MCISHSSLPAASHCVVHSISRALACPGRAGGRAVVAAPPAVSNTCQPPLERASIGRSLFYSAAAFQYLCKNLMAFETLALPPALVKTDQQIQKLSGTDERLAHKNLMPLQTTQCLKPDLVLAIYAQSCCLAAAAHINLCLCWINMHLPQLTECHHSPVVCRQMLYSPSY